MNEAIRTALSGMPIRTPWFWWCSMHARVRCHTGWRLRALLCGTAWRWRERSTGFPTCTRCVMDVRSALPIPLFVRHILVLVYLSIRLREYSRLLPYYDVLPFSSWRVRRNGARLRASNIDGGYAVSFVQRFARKSWHMVAIRTHRV